MQTWCVTGQVNSWNCPQAQAALIVNQGRELEKWQQSGSVKLFSTKNSHGNKS
jgi:hypothetical protein